MHAFRLIFASAALATALAAQPQSIIVPAVLGDGMTEGNSSSSYPMNRTALPLKVLYIYDSTNLSDQGVTTPVDIIGLRTRANGNLTGWTGGTYSQMDIKLGYAGVDWTAIDTTMFDPNWDGGAEPAATQYSGPVTVDPGGPPPGSVPNVNWHQQAGMTGQLTLTTPFTYDPRPDAMGNVKDLIVQFSCDGTGWSGSSALHDGQAAGSRVSRIWSTTDPLATAPNGSSSEFGICMEIIYQPSDGVYANLSVDKPVIGPGEPFQCFDTSTSFFGGAPDPIVAWDWDFDGNGTIDSTVQNPMIPADILPGSTFTGYTACGPNDITLTVTANNGTNSITSVGIIEVGAPTAGFMMSANTPAPALVQFTDTSTASPTSWDWDFDGDNVTDSTLQNPQFTYNTEGLFDVTLTVMNACGMDMITRTYDSRSTMCTLFAANNAGNAGGAVYFDLDVLNPLGIAVTQMGVNTNGGAGTSVSLSVYTKPGSRAGFEDDITAWQLVSNAALSTAQGLDVETTFDVPDFCLPQGLWGVAMILNGVGNAYTNGDSLMAGDPASNRFYANVDLTFQGGSAMNFPFVPNDPIFNPRVANVCIVYRTDVTPSFQIIGNGCQNSTGNTAGIGITGSGTITIGNPVTFEVTNARAGQALSFIMVGFTNLGGLPLDLIGMPGCGLYADPVVGLVAPTDGMGTGQATLGVPNDQNSVGLPVYMQGFFSDPGLNAFNAAVSDAGFARIGCQ